MRSQHYSHIFKTDCNNILYNSIQSRWELNTSTSIFIKLNYIHSPANREIHDLLNTQTGGAWSTTAAWHKHRAYYITWNIFIQPQCSLLFKLYWFQPSNYMHITSEAILHQSSWASEHQKRSEKRLKKIFKRNFE